MGQIASAPVELIRVQKCGSATWRAAVAEMQGWRISHEDAHFMVDAVRPGSHAVFGVLDGHGGSRAARLAAQQLPAALAQASRTASGSSDMLTKAVQKAFIDLDTTLREALESGTRKDNSGSTCVAAGLCPAEGGEGFQCFIANAGDSRGLLVSHNAGSATAKELLASRDHKPGCPDERARIEQAGGFVRGVGFGGEVPRLDGNLAVSRGFGDFMFKQDASKHPSEQKVSCVPELFFGNLQRGDFIVLACDGIFDVMSSEALVERVLSDAERDRDLGVVASNILHECLALDSKDNMTLMLVEVGVSGEGSEAEGLVGLERYHETQDEAARQLYRGFLEHCAEGGGRLPEEAREILRRDGRRPDVCAQLEELTGAFLRPGEAPVSALRRLQPPRPGLEATSGAPAVDRGFDRLAELCDVLLASGLHGIYESTREELLKLLAKQRLVAGGPPAAYWQYRWLAGPQQGEVFGPFEGRTVASWIAAGCFSETPAMFRRCDASGTPQAEEWISLDEVTSACDSEAQEPMGASCNSDGPQSPLKSTDEQLPATKRHRSS
mmetsp:Transcript_101412/g.295474  ORF Transcript_101412/g.295474 Transcript_101412/m.295474 type:complete len:553 (+) Transcript_101412:61-1719(+)